VSGSLEKLVWVLYGEDSYWLSDSDFRELVYAAAEGGEEADALLRHHGWMSEEQERRREIEAARTWRESQRVKVPIPKNVRWAVWERDDFTCRHCGSRSDLAVDHIIPESAGGAAVLTNLQTLCRSCNSRKGTRPDPILSALEAEQLVESP